MGTNEVRGQELAEMARAMRAQGATYKQIRATLRVGSDTVTKLLGREGSRGGRPRIPKETRGQARELRHAGMTIPEISQELGLARSTAWQITKDIPWTPAYDTSSRQKDAARRRWDAYEEQRSLERDEARKVALEEIGALADRELMLIGAVLYWAEGTKSKPWSRREQLQFINSDPDVVRLYLVWLRLLGVPRERISFRVNIHESADVTAAERYWAEAVGISPDDLQRTTLKRHVAKTVRKNTGIDYHGCLAVRVRQSVREYWYMEDLWVAIVRSIGCESAAGVREDNP